MTVIVPVLTPERKIFSSPSVTSLEQPQRETNKFILDSKFINYMHPLKRIQKLWARWIYSD